MMVEDRLCDFEGTQDLMWIMGWRCLNCGRAAFPLGASNMIVERDTP
jgi:hypothetical protein